MIKWLKYVWCKIMAIRCWKTKYIRGMDWFFVCDKIKYHSGPCDWRYVKR